MPQPGVLRLRSGCQVAAFIARRCAERRGRQAPQSKRLAGGSQYRHAMESINQLITIIQKKLPASVRRLPSPVRSLALAHRGGGKIRFHQRDPFSSASLNVMRAGCVKNKTACCRRPFCQSGRADLNRSGVHTPPHGPGPCSRTGCVKNKTACCRRPFCQSGRADLNRRPHGPEPCALTGLSHAPYKRMALYITHLALTR